jgi:hypothetical protein
MGDFDIDLRRYQSEMAQKRLKKGQNWGVLFTVKLTARFCK